MPRQADRDFLDQAKKRFKLAQEATAKQRDRIREDLRFYAGDQWSRDALTARQAQTASAEMPFPAPARPALVINLMRESVRQVLNAEEGADYAIELVPADDFGGLVPTDPANATEIELREGLIRRIQRESEAEDARTWAGARAAIAGEGYYCVLTRYLPGKTWDQEVYVQRLYDQSSALLDPAHEQPDGSDAEWGFITNDYISWSEYKATWPRRADGTRNPIASAGNDEFQSFVEGDPEWFRIEGEDRYCRIADYWYVERQTRTLVQLRDGSTAWKDEITDESQVVDSREVIEKTIQWCKLDGEQVLEETDWPGHFIPIVKVLGEELQPYDQERRAEGMVRPARDSQQGLNAMISKLVETIGLSPIPPFQATPDQVQGFEKWYQFAGIYAAPYLPYNLVSDGGKPLPPPQRTPVDTPIQALAASVQMFRDAFQSTIGIHDPQLGKVDPSLKSGRAIQALQQQSAHGTSNFLDHLKRSMRYEARIENDLLYPIYGTPGRIARILTKEGEPQTVRIGPSPNGQSMPQKSYALTKDANFNVVVKVSQGFDSRRQQEAATIADLLSAQPLFMTWFGDLFFKNSDFPGHQELADRVKVMLDPKIQQVLAQQAQGNGDVSPQAQMLIQQLQGRVQQAEQLLQQAMQELQGKQAEAQTKLQVAQMQQQTQIELRKMADATALAVAKLNLLAKGVIADQESRDEALALQVEQDRTAAELQHEQRMQVQDQVHEHVQNQLDRGHEAATMGLEQDAASREAERQRAHEIELQPEAEAETT